MSTFSPSLYYPKPHMLKNFFIGILFSVSFIGELHSQKSYWVFFTDKNGTSFDPYSYFAPEAIQRRINLGISLYDSSDFPVNEKYLAQISEHVNSVGHITRWFNGVGVDATEDQIEIIRQFPFVKEVLEQSSLMWKPACATIVSDTNPETLRDVHLQIDPMQGALFKQHNLTGKGIIISVIDVGFYGVDVHPAFQNVRFNNNIRSTFDFARDKADVYAEKSDHGSSVLSCIAGIVNGNEMGLAPDATFLLAKIATPWTSQPKGEENFVAALEWSDKQGAMLVNCSDGPDYESYFPEQMNGKCSMMSCASNIAARKGMLIIAAAGNEGETNSPVLLPPADADSVLCVTALNDAGYIASYSSIGPTPDFKHKPDVSAPGSALVAGGKYNFNSDEGTSFSSPLIVGFAACLVQMYPDLSPTQIIDSLHKSSSLYPYFDYSHGYGTPQASYFFDTTSIHPATFKLSRMENTAVITFEERYKPICNATIYPKIYYNLEDEKGRIYKYFVEGETTGNNIVIPELWLREGIKINVFYQGYYASLQL